MIKPNEISFLPESPGCYLFYDENKIIYVGKAKNLKKRVTSYFQKVDHSPKTLELISKIKQIDFIVTNSESEALLLENNLIKLHYPKYNIDLKDSRRYAYLVLVQDEIPYLEVARNRLKKGEYFGPFTSGNIRKTVMDVVSRTFKVLTRPASQKLKKLIEKNEYKKRVEKARLILSGKVDELIKQLQDEMKKNSEIKNYEYSLILRNQITALNFLKEKQIMELSRSIDGIIINYSIISNEIYLLLFNLRKGIVEDKQEFVFDEKEDFLEEFLVQYFDTLDIPSLILVPEKVSPLINDFLSKKANKKVKIIVPKSGEKKELLDFVKENIGPTFFAGNERVEELKKVLHLEKLPRIIECFDISHLSGTNTVASMVTFKDGLPDKSNYRKFKIRTESNSDDLVAMEEVIRRRYTRVIKDNLKKPDLIVIDGGPTQLGVAINILRELNLTIPVISLAKQFEEIYFPISKIPLRLDKKNKGLQLLISLRDETHRFGVTYQRSLRTKNLVKK
ncbi:MAG: excinuclease ABC subunit UvrC [Candidatus ainarchaeum sp.]|nr:excinuclease ABC subunit UvrC [Candidatus ainarchaeum sp.]